MEDLHSHDSEIETCISDFYGNLRQPNMTPERVATVYTNWAEKFENIASTTKWVGPQKSTDALVDHLHGKKDVRILDVGAGTGLTAKLLHEKGFMNIDALDSSEGMLKVAKDQDLYKQYFVRFFTDKNEDLQSNTYDVLIGSGVLEHIECRTMAEMVRIVKKGGLIVLITREKFLLTGDDFKYQWHLQMAQLEHQGYVRLLERKFFRNYMKDIDGNVYVFEVMTD